MANIIEILGLVIEVGKCIGPPIKRHLKCIGAPIKRHLNYLCCFSNNIQSLNEEAQKLEDKHNYLQGRVEGAKDDEQVICHDVESWLEKARTRKDEINGIKEDVAKVQKGCLNLIAHYSLSKRANKTVEEIKKLCNEFQFEQIAQDAKEEFETRKKIEEGVMEALRDAKVYKIGLYGMGGIGKTTMAQRIMDRVKEEKLFDRALKVVVGQKGESHEIRESIAKQLQSLNDKELEGKADEMRTRPTGTMSTLVVLDDLWKTFELKDSDLPSERCKVLFTSRDHRVLHQMGAKPIFNIQVLSDSEAWSLFTKTTGNCANGEDLRSVAEDVAKECKGLPVALVTVGKALRNEENRQHWDDARLQLRRAAPIDLQGGVLEKVYNPLKLSYDFLRDEQAKSLFLLCSMFEEDASIDLETLTWYGMGLNMFERFNLTEARNRTCALIKLLKERSLLLDGYSEHYVEMHDVVRDVAIYTASKEKRGGFVIDFDRRSWENCPEDCLWISVTNLRCRTELPVEFKCPSARLLMMQGGGGHVEELTLPDNFFDGMQEIRVLSMQYIYIRSLSPTTRLLKNLKTLCLYVCRSLESISVVGELLKLEILSCIDCDDIEALPTEIGRLNRLRLLKIIRCRNLKRIARGVISNLISLEELIINNSFRGWEAKESTNTEENATLVELEPLRKLTCLDIEINNASLVAEEISLPSLIVKCHIVIMKTGTRDIRLMHRNLAYFQHKIQYCRTMCLEIPGHDMNVGNWIKTLLRSTEFLVLKGDGANQLINLVEPEKLKSLTLLSCSSVKTLVNTTSVFRLLETLILGGFGDGLDNLEEIMDSHNLHMAFPKLNYLELRGLPRLVIAQETLDKIVAPDNLRELVLDSLNDDAISSIWCVFSSFRNLERVEIHRMNGIKNLMSSSIAINLVHLKKLVVNQCKMMLEVIANNDEEEGEVQEIRQISLFPRLEYLFLGSLHNLRSFCQWNHHNTTLELLSLEHLSIYDCRKMETFAQQSVSTPKLKKGLFNLDHDVEIKDLNETILQYFKRRNKRERGEGGGGGEEEQ